MKSKKLFVFVMAVLLVLSMGILTSCGGDDSGAESNEPEKKSEYKVGETATVDDVDITLVNVTESTGDGSFAVPAEGNVFAIVEFEIANNSDEELSVSSLMCFDAYCDDTAVDQSIEGLLAPEAESKQQLDGSVAAGKKMVGVIVYEVPSDFTKMEVDVSLDVFSGEPTRFVYTR